MTRTGFLFAVGMFFSGVMAGPSGESLRPARTPASIADVAAIDRERILKAAGTDLEHCVKVTVFLADMENFARLNRVYNEYFGDTKPARTCVQVARLPLDVDIEIEAIAVLPG